MQTEYHAALLHLRMQTRCFTEAFAAAAQAAQGIDPADGQIDPVAQTAMVEITAALQAVCTHIPGAAEVFAIAISAQAKES